MFSTRDRVLNCPFRLRGMMTSPLWRYLIGHSSSILGLEARLRVKLQDLTEHWVTGTSLIELFEFC